MPEAFFQKALHCQGVADFGRKGFVFQRISQASSVVSITKLSRSFIDDQRWTVILRRWNRTDYRYRPCSHVDEIELTVNIDRD